MWAWVKAILLLPVMPLVVFPAIILYATHYHFQPITPLRLILTILFFCAGACLAIWTMYLFDTQGNGTAAPWNPPKRLVIQGPYRYVRNPMITSVLLLLLAEYVFLKSTGILILFGLFLIGNMIYFPLVEEKGLEKRFGQDYLLYKQNVPRWIPRVMPWDLPSS